MSIFEYRFYDVMPGRLGEEVQRMYDVAIAPWENGPASLFDRFGIPRPLAAWTGVAGRRQPVFGYLLEWESLAARDAAFLPFWMSREWAEFSAKTDDGRQMVERIDTLLLSPSMAWKKKKGILSNAVGGLHEMRCYQVEAGHSAEAMDYLAQIELQQMEVLGGEVLGVFDVVIGPDMPMVISFIAWPDFATQQGAARRLEAEPRVKAARESWHQHYGRPLIRHVEQSLLRPTFYGKARTNFAAPNGDDA